MQKFYLHDAASGDTGTLPVATVAVSGPAYTAPTAATNRALGGVIGTAQVSQASTNVNAATKWMRRFISDPLAAGTYSAGNWTIATAGAHSNALNDDSWQYQLVLWRPSTGALITRIIDAVIGASFLSTPTEGATSDTVAGAGFTAQDGDILVLEIWVNALGGSTDTVTHYYDGTTEGSATTNAGYLLAPVDIPLQGAGPPPPVGPGFFQSKGNPGPRMN